jgi:hypothetical protein
MTLSCFANFVTASYFKSDTLTLQPTPRKGTLCFHRH